MPQDQILTRRLSKSSTEREVGFSGTSDEVLELETVRGQHSVSRTFTVAVTPFAASQDRGWPATVRSCNAQRVFSWFPSNLESKEEDALWSSMFKR
eukprot:scaffold338_cov361-Pavlova_lutheri.AAC.33